MLAENMGIFGGWLPVMSGIPFFVEGTLIYFCFKENKQMPINICLVGLILTKIIFGKVDNYLYSFIFMLLIIMTESFSFKKFTIRTIFQKIDQYSYTIYLIHGIVFIHILDRYSLERMLEVIIAVAGTAILTVIVHHIIEKPIQNKLNSILK